PKRDNQPKKKLDNPRPKCIGTEGRSRNRFGSRLYAAAGRTRSRCTGCRTRESGNDQAELAASDARSRGGSTKLTDARLLVSGMLNEALHHLKCLAGLALYKGKRTLTPELLMHVSHVGYLYGYTKDGEAIRVGEIRRCSDVGESFDHNR